VGPLRRPGRSGRALGGPGQDETPEPVAGIAHFPGDGLEEYRVKA
jgi:hypothetical protein